MDDINFNDYINKFSLKIKSLSPTTQMDKYYKESKISYYKYFSIFQIILFSIGIIYPSARYFIKLENEIPSITYLCIISIVIYAII